MTIPQPIEPLEARIAPAALVGNVLTYTDIDGDLVKVTFTHAAMARGTLSSARAAWMAPPPHRRG